MCARRCTSFSEPGRLNRKRRERGLLKRKTPLGFSNSLKCTELHAYLNVENVSRNPKKAIRKPPRKLFYLLAGQGLLTQSGNFFLEIGPPPLLSWTSSCVCKVSKEFEAVLQVSKRACRRIFISPDRPFLFHILPPDAGETPAPKEDDGDQDVDF